MPPPLVLQPSKLPVSKTVPLIVRHNLHLYDRHRRVAALRPLY